MKHLNTLAEAGLLEREREGRDVRYRVTPEPLSDAVTWIAEVGGEWDARLAALRSSVRSSAARRYRGARGGARSRAQREHPAAGDAHDMTDRGAPCPAPRGGRAQRIDGGVLHNSAGARRPRYAAAQQRRRQGLRWPRPGADPRRGTGWSGSRPPATETVADGGPSAGKPTRSERTLEATLTGAARAG